MKKIYYRIRMIFCLIGLLFCDIVDLFMRPVIRFHDKGKKFAKRLQEK